MIPATGGRIAGAILAAALGSVVAVSALAVPKKVTELKGSHSICIPRRASASAGKNRSTY